jgi:hypothetical protein
MLTTTINVCASQGGDWSVMAIVTTVVTGTTLLVPLALLCVYKFYLLKKVKQEDAIVRYPSGTL